MRFVLHALSAVGLVGLVAITASMAEGQTRIVHNSPGSSVASSPRAGSGALSTTQSAELSSRMARRLAGPGAKMLTVEDVVDGGVYFEDPVSGKLILGEAPAGSSGTASARVASRPPGSVATRAPSNTVTRAPSSVTTRAPSSVVTRAPSSVVTRAPSGTSRVVTRAAAPPVVEPVQAIEDVVMEDIGMGEFEYGDACCEAGDCGECSSCLVPCGAFFPAGNLELFAGVQGFTGPANSQTGGGSFGFHQGLNWGMPIPLFGCLGGQVGFRATQSNLSGSEISDDTRRQAFVTAGLFRRVDVGLQGGVVVDWLSDGWYRDIDLVNLRAELSWMIDSTHELGFWGTAGTKDANDLEPNEQLGEWETTDLYAFFYRYNFGDCEPGSARLFAGWSGQGDGLIGTDARLPLSATWALETNFTYLIPNESEGLGFAADHVQESWNVAMSLVWYPGRRWGQGDPYYRPLFRVADNGTFMMDRILP